MINRIFLYFVSIRRYIENCRFSEDLDFTALEKAFVHEQKNIEKKVKTIEKKTGIQFFEAAINNGGKIAFMV